MENVLSVYEKNILICEKAKPEFYKKLRLFYTEDYRAGRFRENRPDSIRLDGTREGLKIVAAARDGREYRLGSAVRPSVEAQRWASQIEGGGGRVVSVFGFASGLYAREALKRIGGDARLLVYEPSFGLFDFVLHNYDITDILEDSRLELIVEDVDRLAFKEALIKYMNYFNLERQQIVVLPQYRELFPASYERFCARLRESDERIVVNKNTLVRFNRTSAENTLKNIYCLADTNLAEDLGQIVPRDIPVILVSAGPSLDKNIGELRRAKGKAFILAVDTAIKYMLNYDIIPDATITVEPEKPLGHYEDSRCDMIPLIFDIESNHEIVKRCRRRRFLFNARGYVKNLLSRLGVESTETANGGSVATAAFALCYKLDFKRIILVGQDLSYEGTTTHAGGVESKGINNDVGCTMIEGIDGGQVRSRSDWLAYLRWFENAIEVIKDLGKDAEIIDATEGGALIHGSRVMTLKDAVSEFCTHDYSFEKALADVSPMLVGEKLENLIEEHREAMSELGDICSRASEILPLCIEICSELEASAQNAAGSLGSELRQKAQRVAAMQKRCEEARIYPLLNNYAVGRVAEQIQGLYMKPADMGGGMTADFKRTAIAFEALRDACREIMSWRL